LTLAQQFVSFGYPLIDVVLLGMAACLLLSPGARTPACVFVCAALMAALVADISWAWTRMGNLYPRGHLSEGGRLLSYLCWALAALHPSVARLAQGAASDPERLTQRRLVLLASSTLLVPLAVAVQSALNQPINMVIFAGGSIVLFLLALLRMNVLVKLLLGAITRNEQAIKREQTLRTTSAALVASTTRDSIYTAALNAVVALTEQTPPDFIGLATGTDGQLTFVSSMGRHAHGVNGTTLDFGPLIHPIRNAVMGRGAVELLREDCPDPFRVMNVHPDVAAMFLMPFFIQQDLRAAIIIASREDLPPESWATLEALSSQVALALESESLATDLHRRRSEERFRSLVQNTSDMISVIDADGIIRYESPSVARILGYDPAELVGTNWFTMIHPDDATFVQSFFVKVLNTQGVASPVELRLRHRSGQWVQVETIGTNLLHDPNVGGIVFNTRDIRERKAFEHQLHHQAFHDPLTGLPNRALFVARVEHALDRCKRHSCKLAVLFLDLDGFKYVNDSLGHEVGDALLISVAARIERALRPGDTAARFGGDEFTILLEDVQSAEDVALVAERVLRHLQEPIYIMGRELFISASVGVAINESPNDSPTDLLRYADVAMYRAKNSGKAHFELFDASMNKTAWDRLELEHALRQAIEREEFRVYYQPKVDLASGRIVGMEALVRWEHPQRGLVSPNDFIPLAEETGLVLRIGYWVLQQACHQARLWHDKYPSDPPLVMSVNLSSKQFGQPDLVPSIARVVRESGLPAQSLKLEITESIVMDDTEATIAKLHELKALGVQLAIDDFGTGYSSLSYLKRLPLDTIKIDRAFVAGVVDHAEDRAIVQAVTTLAHSLNLTVTAEGVETADVWEHLRGIGVELGQGYYFAGPLPSDALEAMLMQNLRTVGGVTTLRRSAALVHV
jgi:diguanylate cyclase (GGDEF)-like protein/PAS domain S-box-containing protein